ncbi:ras and Rab interactor 2 [Osmerus eperlanus]|uniref:ras and Rab interactor 2 n=1 Tax=Osmerus eperlanus TaxID=29151 RepID=UPI002E0D15CC
MSTDAPGQPCQRERKGSFFKLIDSFAWEIGTLKKEMVQKAEPAVRDPGTVTLQGLQGEVACLFQRSPPSAGIGTGLARARDSGYDSLHRLMSVLDRLIQTHGVWLQLGLNHADATRILQSHPTGTFLVRKSTTLQRKVISLRMDPDSETPVRDFPVKESQYTFSLEGSGLSFADLFRLVAFCCISRDVLPFTLKLPEAISSAKTPSDLEEVAKLGAGFWDSDKSRPRTHSVSWLSGVSAQPAEQDLNCPQETSHTTLYCHETNNLSLPPPLLSFSLFPFLFPHTDQVLEKAMHKCVLKPLKGVVGLALQEFQVRCGGWQELKENLSLAKARQPREMGVADALPPDPVAIEKIRHKFHTMCKLYSPEKKVTVLLRVCKLIYTIMEDNSGRLYGADDFLPMLTYVLAQCDMPQLDNEILYMMELLDPSLLNGEGGYYLTSAYGAMSLIRNFQEEQAARILSSETRNTLHQWHRRRTTQRLAPSVDDFQNYLRVALQELDSGCTAKTLLVRPYATTEEVCKICAEKFKVSDPENYALFLLAEGTSQQLAPDTHPQKIKAELHSRAQSTPFHFVFRRVITLNESSAAPLDLTLNLNELAVTSDLQSNLNDLTLTTSKPHPNLNLGLSPSLGLSLPPNQHNGNSISI